MVVEAQLQLDHAFRSVREQRTGWHDAAVETAAFSPDGRLVVTASKDNTARLFDVTSGRQVARLAHDGKVNGATFSPTAAWLRRRLQIIWHGCSMQTAGKK